MAREDRAVTRSIRQYRYQFAVIFIATYAATFFVFPPVIWFTGPDLPEGARFFDWLWRSYKVAFMPVLGLFSRAFLVAALLLLPCLYLMKRVRFTTAGFLIGATFAVFATVFIAVWTTPGLYRDSSAMASQLQFAVALSLTSATCALLIGLCVVRLDIKKRPRGLR
jgi:hypothetical protein